jgi:hypothetical protein
MGLNPLTSMLLLFPFPEKTGLVRLLLAGGRYGLVLLFCWPLTFIQAQGSGVLVADLTLDVPPAAAIAAPFATHYYGFQQGDVLLLNLENEKGKATFSLDIVDQASGSPVFSVRQVKKLRNLRLPIARKAVYQFTLRADAAAGANTCHFTIRRLPAHDSVRHFNPHVTWHTRSDTTWTTATEKVLVKTDLVPQTLLDKQFRVEAKANLMANNKTTVRFQLPKSTRHWVYWVGVGQEPVVQLNDITKQVSKMAASVLAGTNPVIAFGMGLLPYLPQVTSGGNIDYYFMNQANAQAFLETGKLKAYPFASGQKIVSDYLKVPGANTPKTEDGHLYMGFLNNNTLTGLDITLKVVAFTAEQTFETRQVRKPAKITHTKVPVFGD